MHFYVDGAPVEWGPAVRNRLMQVAADSVATELCRQRWSTDGTARPVAISGRLPMGPLDYGQFPRFLLVQKASTAVVVVWWQVTAALVEGNVLSVFGNLLVASYSSRRAKVSLHL